MDPVQGRSTKRRYRSRRRGPYRIEGGRPISPARPARRFSTATPSSSGRIGKPVRTRDRHRPPPLGARDDRADRLGPGRYARTGVFRNERWDGPRGGSGDRRRAVEDRPPSPLTTPLSRSGGRLYAGHETVSRRSRPRRANSSGPSKPTRPSPGRPPSTTTASGVARASSSGPRTRPLSRSTPRRARCWTVPTDGAVTGGPTVADGRVYVADDGGTLLALGGDTGQTWFTYQVRGSLTSSATVLVDDELEDGGTTFVGADDGYLHVTDTTFGRRKVRGWLFSKKGSASTARFGRIPWSSATSSVSVTRQVRSTESTPRSSITSGITRLRPDHGHACGRRPVPLRRL